MPGPAIDSPKADFIRSLDVSVKTGEVIKRAKAAGLSLSPTYVRNVRIAMAGKRPAKAVTSRTPTAPTASSAQTPPTPSMNARPGSKRAFVLSLSKTMPVSDVLSAAKSRGVSLTPGYVYWVRSDAARGGRVRGQSKKRSVASTAKQPVAKTARSEDTSSAPLPRMNAGSAARPSLMATAAERALVSEVVRVVGIERAIAILEVAKSRLGRLLDD